MQSVNLGHNMGTLVCHNPGSECQTARQTMLASKQFYFVCTVGLKNAAFHLNWKRLLRTLVYTTLYSTSNVAQQKVACY
jgi:hypothetical protein